MATRLEGSQGKLVRLIEERDMLATRAIKNVTRANGQPMNDKRGGPAFFKQIEKDDAAIFAKLDEIRKQEKLIDYMKDKEHKKAMGLTANYGLETSVQNIDKLKERLKETQEGQKTTSTNWKIASDKKKIDALELIIEKEKQDINVMSDKTKKLIESGKVTKWDKKPIYYFVKGCRKTALVINPETGEFLVAGKYPPISDEDKAIVMSILEQ